MQEETQNHTPLTNITSASEIKRRSQELKQGKLIELPSGIFVKMLRPSFRGLLKAGKIPSALIPSAMKMVGGSNTSMSKKDLDESMEVVEIMVRESMLEPKMVKENPQEDEVTIEDFSDEDIGFMMNYTQRGVTDLKPFRGE